GPVGEWRKRSAEVLVKFPGTGATRSARSDGRQRDVGSANTRAGIVRKVEGKRCTGEHLSERRGRRGIAGEVPSENGNNGSHGSIALGPVKGDIRGNAVARDGGLRPAIAVTAASAARTARTARAATPSAATPRPRRGARSGRPRRGLGGGMNVLPRGNAQRNSWRRSKDPGRSENPRRPSKSRTMSTRHHPLWPPGPKRLPGAQPPPQRLHQGRREQLELERLHACRQLQHPRWPLKLKPLQMATSLSIPTPKRLSTLMRTWRVRRKKRRWKLRTMKTTNEATSKPWISLR
ncbi:unnamed protein product, partial [Cladocopium goreaui]